MTKTHVYRCCSCDKLRPEKEPILWWPMTIDGGDVVSCRICSPCKRRFLRQLKEDGNG